MDPRDAFPLKCWLSSPGTPPLSMVHQVWLLGLRDHGGEDEERPLPMETQSRWTLGSQPPGLGTSRRPPCGRCQGGPLTQQQLPQGLLCRLPASGPEVALGISNLEPGLLPDEGGRGTWGKSKSPQVAASPLGREVVGPGAAEGVPEREGAARGTNPLGAVGGDLCRLVSLPEKGARVDGGVLLAPGAIQPAVGGGGRASLLPSPPSPELLYALVLSGKGAARTREGSKEGKGICSDTDARALIPSKSRADPWTKESYSHRSLGLHHVRIKHITESSLLNRRSCGSTTSCGQGSWLCPKVRASVRASSVPGGRWDGWVVSQGSSDSGSF